MIIILAGLLKIYCPFDTKSICFASNAFRSENYQGWVLESPYGLKGGEVSPGAGNARVKILEVVE